LSSEDNHWKYSSGSEVLTGGLTGPLDSSKGSISCGNSNLLLDFSFKMDDDFDDYGSDISLYEESDEESDGENVQDLNPTYLWTVQNSDR
jgi:hypothetical protein